MRKTILTLLVCLVTAISARADFLGVYDNGNDGGDDSVWVYISMWDSLALKFEIPDTLFIHRFGPAGDTLSIDTVTSLTLLNYADGYYMKRYRAGAIPGQYTVHIRGSGNGNYYSLANHTYYVNDAGLADFLTVSDISGLSLDIDDIKTATDKLDFDANDSLITKGYAGGGSCSVPDSLLGVVTKIDTMYASVGRPGVSGQTPSLHMKIGLGYDGQAGTGNVKDHLDSLTAYTGKHNLSIPNIVSLHNKIGNYAGTSGPGNNIKDDIVAIGATGGGTEPETLIVLAAADSTHIQGARATVRTLDQSTTKVTGLATDVDGRLILALDPGSFWIEMTANNYLMVTDTLIVLAGGGTDTLLMSLFDPGAPPNPDLCRVYGWVYDISGDSLAGIEITVEIPREYHPVKYGSAVITPFSKSTVSDSTGYWYIDLIPTTLLSDQDSEYIFTIKYLSGVVYRAKAAVPELTGWQLQ